MSNSNNIAYIESQKLSVMKCMVGLMQNLQKLSPHPERPNFRGALFTAVPSWCHAPGAQDGMAGMAILGGMMEIAYGEAISNATHGASESINLGTCLDLYEAYRSHVEEDTQRVAAHGRGTLARMSGTSISRNFNTRGNLSTAMQAFLEDLPARMKIERQLAAYIKQLAALDTNPAAAVAAPAPRYAA